MRIMAVNRALRPQFLRGLAVSADRQEHMAAILQKACWATTDQRELYKDTWDIIDQILKMEGKEKEVLMTRVRVECPTFFQCCID